MLYVWCVGLFVLGRILNLCFEYLLVDEDLNMRKLFGFAYGKRAWMVYGSDVLLGLMVYQLSGMSGWDLAFGIVLAVLLYTTWLTDVRSKLILDVFTYPGIVLFLVYGIYFGPYVWWMHIVGGVFMCVLLGVLGYVMRGKLGGGDVKLFTALGFYLGFMDVTVLMLVSALLGLVYGGCLYVVRKRSTAYAFGPFIVIGVMLLWMSDFSMLDVMRAFR